jgi:hypothetical protein
MLVGAPLRAQVGAARRFEIGLQGWRHGSGYDPESYLYNEACVHDSSLYNDSLE